ncbi:MAG: redoxin domain-containing protein [Deltaproteobacteria bacterium]|nr:redoxin domain-containing protein [Deltaproteobacteria bacterium]
MKKLRMIWTILACLLFLPAFLAAEVAPPAEGGKLPDIRLTIPADAGYQTYLGIKGEGTFFLPQVKASVVIVEIFSMYCPHCQREAPSINDLYAKIQSSERLKAKAKLVGMKDKVKLVGIGVGNSPYEVEYFKKTYSIQFPLFSDGEFIVHKQLGEVRTPYFIGIKNHRDGSHTLFYSKLGGIADNLSFLKLIQAQLNK